MEATVLWPHRSSCLRRPFHLMIVFQPVLHPDRLTVPIETGSMPVRDVARELGSLGLLGMHLEGYGCVWTSATAYGLACLELTAP